MPDVSKKIYSKENMKIILPISPAINRMYKMGNGRFYKNQEAKDWEVEASWVIIQHKANKKLTDKPVKVHIDFYFKKDRDIDSSLKGLLDLLQGKLIKNDSQIKELHVYKYLDKENPRVEILVEEL